MALTITSVGNNVSTTNNTTLASGATVTASVGDVLLICIAASNDGTAGAARTVTIADNAGGSTNVYSQRGTTGNATAGTIGDGASQYFFECPVTTALSNATVTVTFSGNVNQKSFEIYRLQPGVDEAVAYVSVGTAQNSTPNTGLTTHAASTVSVTSGHTIFGMAAIETDDTITGDSDTTNGSWSTVSTRLADGGLDVNTMSCTTQYKTVNATGNQSWAATTASARDSSSNYIIYRVRPAYTLTATQQSFSVSGVTTNLRATRVLGGTQQTYSVAGVTTGLQIGVPYDSAINSTYDSQTTATYEDYRLPTSGAPYTLVADQGSVTVSVFDAGLKVARKLTADLQTYAVSGVTTNLKAGRKLTADLQTYAVSGVTTNLRATRKLTATQQTYDVSGVNVNLRATRSLTATLQTFSVSGVTTNLRAARKLIGDLQTYSVSGVTTGLNVTRKLVALLQTYDVTGQTAAFTYAGNAPQLTAFVTTFAVTGYNAGLSVTRSLTATPRSYAVSSETANLKRGLKLSADLQTYDVAGVNATLTKPPPRRVYIIT